MWPTRRCTRHQVAKTPATKPLGPLFVQNPMPRQVMLYARKAGPGRGPATREQSASRTSRSPRQGHRRHQTTTTGHSTQAHQDSDAAAGASQPAQGSAERNERYTKTAWKLEAHNRKNAGEEREEA
eukprot:11940245-Alexandrium_andersonii.AAC.1